MGVARVSLPGGRPVPRPAVSGREFSEGGGQAAAGAQMLTWAAAVRVVTPRPAAGKAGRVLGKRRDKPAWRRRWKSSTSKGERPTTALSHASTTREGVAKRWHGHVQAGLSSREISFPGCPHCPKGGRQHRWRR